MKTFKTPKGTALRISDIKGKDYLGCDQRVIWFREEHPHGRIETERISESDKHITYRATISVCNEDGYVKLSNADKTLRISAVTDYEKCETMAIGRALALCGFGTQFCGDDLDEGEHVADSPREPKAKNSAPQNYFNPPTIDENEKFAFEELPEPGKPVEDHEYQITFDVMEKNLGVPHILKILSQKNKKSAEFYASIGDGLAKYKSLTPKQRAAIEKDYNKFILTSQGGF